MISAYLSSTKPLLLGGLCRTTALNKASIISFLQQRCQKSVRMIRPRLDDTKFFNLRQDRDRSLVEKGIMALHHIIRTVQRNLKEEPSSRLQYRINSGDQIVQSWNMLERMPSHYNVDRFGNVR